MASSIKPRTWWSTLRSRLGAAADGAAPAAARRRLPAVRLHAVGLPVRELQSLRPVLERLCERLALRFELLEQGGEIVLLDVDYAGRTPTHIVHALKEDRPVVLVSAIDQDAAPLAERIERRHDELLRQLMNIPLVCKRSVRWSAAGWLPQVTGRRPQPDAPISSLASAFDSEFDSTLDAEELRAETPNAAQNAFVRRVVDGLRGTNMQLLAASYGPGAGMRLDFDGGVAQIDALALQALRVRRELPALETSLRLTVDAQALDLDRVAWDIGLACGRFALLGAPPDDWHAPLIGVALERIERHTRQPRHLELGRRLATASATPSELRRHVRISVRDLRCFVQACLFLDLVRWAPPAR